MRNSGQFKKGNIPWSEGKKLPAYRRIDLTNKKFGNLIVISLYGKNSSNSCIWICKCICNNETKVLSSNLIRGKTKSCGCLRGKSISDSKITHGQVNTSTYNSWANMIQRCTNPNVESYEYYGNRGIKVCDRWLHSFENFLEDMGHSSRGLSIDRINSKGNYEPGNCRWIPKEENSRKAMMEKYHANI